MNDLLKRTLLSVMHFDQRELDEFQSITKAIQIKKGECLNRTGDSINRIGFLLKGVLEMTYVDKNESESVVDFFFPGSFVVDYVSYLTRTPAQTEVRAISNAELFILERGALDQLYDKSIRFQKFGRLMAEIEFVNFAKRLREGSLPPNERYYKLMEEHQDWVAEIPQYKIASYLNISPEWLSKIRATR